MANESNAPEQKIVSKKHIARVEKEKKQRKVLLIGIFSILAIVVLLIVYGILSKTVLLAGRTVAVVNSEKITVEEFQKRVRYERLSTAQTFLNYQLSYYATYFQTQLLEMQNELDQYITFGGTVLDNMITDTVLVQKAKELGFTVSDEEVNKELEENFGYYANGTPTPAATLEYKPTSTLSLTQLAIITPTLAPTDMPTVTEEPATATPDLTSQPTEDLAAVTPTETATATAELPTNTPTVEMTATQEPTATPYTYEGYTTLYSTVVADLETQTEFGDAEFRDYVRTILYKQKIYDYVTKDIATEQEMVWARHILVSTEENAQLVLDGLAAGEDFATLAATYSQDTSNSYSGGDLGWIYKGQMVEEFENAAWGLEIGEVSEPIQTSFGYHIIQVLGHEVRQLSADELSSAKSTAYQKYIDEVEAEATIVKKDIWASVVPSEPSIPTEYRISTDS